MYSYLERHGDLFWIELRKGGTSTQISPYLKQSSYRDWRNPIYQHQGLGYKVLRS